MRTHGRPPAPRRRRPLAALALALALGAAVTLIGGLTMRANGSVRSEAGASATSALVVNMPIAPATLDPGSACGLYDFTVIENTYARLTRYGSKPGPRGTTKMDPGHIVPYFAKSWKITNGGKVYTFKLQPGVKFPSGKPMDAKAVKYSLERSITMGGCGGYFVLDGIYTPPLIKSIATPNPTTLVITLSVPDANVLQDWAQPAASIVDKSVVDAHGGVQKGKINTWMSGHVAGWGPFTVKSYEANKQVVLVSNPKFFAPGKAQQITVNWIASDPTLLLQARSGAADVTIGLSKQSVHSLENNSAVKVVANDVALAEQIGLVNNRPPFDNVKFREAMSYAVPYQDILNKVAFGYATLFYGPLPPAMAEFNASLEKPRQQDIAKAKALIAASGVKTPVTVELDIQAGNSTDEQIATIVQGTWQQLGVNVQINKLSASDYINKIQGHKSQAYLRLDGPGVVEAGYYLDYDLKCGVSFNIVAVCIPKADTILAKARKETNKTKRQAMWDQIARLWIADSPKIPVYGEKSATVLSKRVKSYFYSFELDFSSWSK
jgi:peptide/nickel transport system substrate-binding protein